MSANAGEIRARLVLSNDEFKRKMDDARGDIDKTSFSAQKLNEDFGKIQKASLIAGGAIATLVGGSVKVAAEFEQSMSQVQAISGSTAEEFARQEEAARKMGAETVFSAKFYWSVIKKLIAKISERIRWKLSLKLTLNMV